MGMFKELKTSEAWKRLAADEAERRKSIKIGPTAMHLDYLSGIITPEDLKSYEEGLANEGIVFSSYNKSGAITASFDELTLITSIALSNTSVLAILEGTLTNATWDAIKYVVINIWKKSKGQSYNKAQVGKLEKKPLSFGLSARLDKNTSYEFELSGDFSEKMVSESLDKVLEFLKEQTLNSHYKLPKYTMYDQKKGIWKAIDVEAEMLKRAKNKSSKSRK